MFVIDLPRRNCVSKLSGTDSTLHACRLGSECGMREREINNNNVCVPCLVALAAGYTNVIIYYWYLRCVVLQVCLCECLLTVYKKTNFADMFKKQEQT